MNGLFDREPVALIGLAAAIVGEIILVLAGAGVVSWETLAPTLTIIGALAGRKYVTPLADDGGSG